MAKLTAKRKFGIVLIIASLGSLYFVPWIIVSAWLMPLPDSVQGQIEQSTGKVFEGILVYVDQAGKTPQSYAAGWHNREDQIPARPDALFKIASISKLYAAVAITKMASNGQLSLDNSIADYLPDMVGVIDNADEISLRLMIQHRSGIPNFTDTPDFWGNPTETFEESIALIDGMPANFEPGEGYEYCNTNYLLLAKIMDKELGYPHYQFIQEEILDPLGLKNTYPNLEYVDMDNVMSGYHIGYPYDLKEDEHGMLATAEDVGLFLRAMHDGSVFDPGEKELYASVYEFDHGGWVPGYQSFANYDKDLDAVVVSFYNTTDEKLYNWNLSEVINKRIFKILSKDFN